MPAGAKTSQFLQWRSIRDRFERCKLPAWDFVYVYCVGSDNFYLSYKAAIAPFYNVAGISPWLGYDDPTPFGYATGGKLWLRLQFRREKDPYRTLAVIDVRQNENGVFMWWFPSMKETTDKNGKHPGWHPCALLAVPKPFVLDWLAKTQKTTGA